MPVSSAVQAQRRLNAVIADIAAIAEREEHIAKRLRILVRMGHIPTRNAHRAHARADTLLNLARELREVVGLEVSKK